MSDQQEWTDEMDDSIYEKAWFQELEIDSGSEEEPEELYTYKEFKEITLVEDQDENVRPNFNAHSFVGKKESIFYQAEIDSISEEEYEEDFIPNVFLWETYQLLKQQKDRFRDLTGLKTKGTSPIDLFLQIWDQPVIEMVVEQTNLYARQKINAASKTGISEESLLHEWVDASVSDIHRLIAIFIYMGMIYRGPVNEYWSTGSLCMPGFCKLMSLERFWLLMRFLHFIDNDTMTTTRIQDKKIAKVSNILFYLNNKFQSIYTPCRESSIDDRLLLSKECSWVQTIWTKVVRQYLGKGYSFLKNIFYNFIPLTEFSKRDIEVKGTLNTHPKEPPCDIGKLDENRVSPAKVMINQHCDLSVFSWKDGRLDITLPTFHNNGTHQRQFFGIPFLKPVALYDLSSKNKGEDDLKNEKLPEYFMESPQRLKWYIIVFRRLIDFSILNCYAIYSANIGPEQEEFTFRQFKYKLADELREKSDIKVLFDNATNIIRLNRSVIHGPIHKLVAETTKVKGNKVERRPCVWCTAKSTPYVCSDCDAFLCVGQCWKEYHTLEVI